MFGVFQLVFNSKDRNRLRSLISSRHRNKLQTEFLGSASDVGHVLKRDARYDLLGCRVKLCSDRTWTELGLAAGPKMYLIPQKNV